MDVVLNGERIPEEKAMVPATAPGLLYGEGCFETLRIAQGKPRFFPAHWERFQVALERLRLDLNIDAETIRQQATELAHHNGVGDGVLRLSGHARASGADWLLMATPPRRHPLPASFSLVISDWPHPGPNPLSIIKHNNYARFRLPFLAAQSQGADDCLLCNADQQVVEGGVSNFFWVDADDHLCTPPEATGALPGIIRAKVLALFPAIIERAPSRPELYQAKEIFLTNSLIEIMPVKQIDARPLATCPGEQTRRVIASFHRAYPE